APTSIQPGSKKMKLNLITVSLATLVAAGAFPAHAGPQAHVVCAATSDVSEQPVSGPLYMKRLKGGVLANGLNSFVSAVFNTFPNS
ncbi:hypothetical protein MJI69_30315, partial [Salmonella enterica subsp. enterica serovar Anatum]|nr:hypothetical protein [Salmonella enterica subsp. enterica serovar Anatum]